MIAILGDIHFDSSKDYYIRICNEFISWFDQWEYNCEGNELILVGDLVASSLNGGIVIDFLEKFYKSSKFDHIHIIEGNHDRKFIEGEPQLAYEFLRNKENVTIYRYPTEKCVQGIQVLFLPFFTRNEKGKTMRDVYSNLYKTYKGPYDLAVGHFCEPAAGFKGAEDCIENLEKLNAKKICLGHIHTREANPDIYIGSVYARRRDEIDYTRAAWIYDGAWKEDPLPVFNTFLYVTYPDSLPASDAIVPIYTVLNCGNEKVAKQKYKDIYIRKCTISRSEKSQEKKCYLDSEVSIKIDIEDVFKAFCDSQKPPLPKEVASTCRALLKKGYSPESQ